MSIPDMIRDVATKDGGKICPTDVVDHAVNEALFHLSSINNQAKMRL